jgi:hypothetical protein
MREGSTVLEAKEAFRKDIYSRLLLGKGNYEEARKKNDEAINSYLLKKDPDLSLRKLYINRGELYIHQGIKTDEAFEAKILDNLSC